MTARELGTLRGQLLLMAGLVVGCAAFAAVIATQRLLVEKYRGEKYPAAAPIGWDRAVNRDELAKLTEIERLALYDAWMSQAWAPPAAPRAMVEADAALYLTRAERTLVCGTAAQRTRTLRFLELAGDGSALPVLRKARALAVRWKDPDFARQIDECIAALAARAAL